MLLWVRVLHFLRLWARHLYSPSAVWLFGVHDRLWVRMWLLLRSKRGLPGRRMTNTFAFGKSAVAMLMVALLNGGVHALQLAAGSPRPDFGGRWVLIGPPEVAAQGAQEQLVTQDRVRQTLTVSAAGSRAITYRLDGSETPVAGEGATSTAVARWDGQSIAITTTSVLPAGLRRVATQVWTLTDGHLAIQFTLVDPPMVMTLVFARGT